MSKTNISHLPEELEARLEKQFGASTVRTMAAALAEPRLPTLRTNTMKTTDDSVMSVFRDENIQFERVKGVPHAFRIRNRTDAQLLAHALCASGKVYMQGIASMLPPLVLDAKPGERILDMCAAPGSKTSQIAAMLEGNGRLLAIEENAIRFQKLQNTLQMQGASFVEARCGDSTLLGREGDEEAFDAVLVDAPCSAEGRIDLRDPRSFSFWSEKNIVAHAKLQRRLLRSAVRCLRVGGRLIYSTCTLAPEENELMVDWLLTECPEMKSVAIALPVPATRVQKNLSVTVLPTKEHEGFFVAKFVKK
jgi:NOL1/NOP2/sun family putative RNA methylase